jgi:hypothetical protein
MEAVMAKQPDIKQGKRQFPIYLTHETHRKLLRRALEESAHQGERISASRLVEELIEEYLKKGA